MHVITVLLTELSSSLCFINHLQVWIKVRDPLNDNMRDRWQREIFSPFWHVLLIYIYILFKKNYVKLLCWCLPWTFINIEMLVLLGAWLESGVIFMEFYGIVMCRLYFLPDCQINVWKYDKSLWDHICVLSGIYCEALSRLTLAEIKVL